MKQFKVDIQEKRIVNRKSKRNKIFINAIESLETKEGIYEKPKLIDQAKYLYYLLNNGDQLPGKDAYARFDELKSEFELIKSKIPIIYLTD